MKGSTKRRALLTRSGLRAAAKLKKSDAPAKRRAKKSDRLVEREAPLTRSDLSEVMSFVLDQHLAIYRHKDQARPRVAHVFIVGTTLGPTERDDLERHGPNLRIGSEGDHVRRLQRLLIGWIPWEAPPMVDGVFGEETEKLVRAFQAHNELAEDGVAGRETWARLLLTRGKRQERKPWMWAETVAIRRNDIQVVHVDPPMVLEAGAVIWVVGAGCTIHSSSVGQDVNAVSSLGGALFNITRERSKVGQRITVCVKAAGTMPAEL